MLNAEELAALAGLPSLAVVAYVLGIRPWMDYRTGLVGVIRGISWQSIREAVEVEGHQGMARVSFSVDQVQRAVAHLEKRGIVTRRSIDAALIFRANFATQDNGDQKKAAPMSAPMSAPTMQAAKQATARNSDNAKAKHDPKAAPKAAPPPAYPLTTNPPSSSYLPNVAGEGWQETTTTIFHRVIKPEFHQAIAEAVSAFPGDVQQLAVDELAGAVIARQGGNNPIRSPLAYLRAILANVRAGSQVWANALEVQAARRADAARIEREKALRAAPAESKQDNAPRFRPGVSLAETLKGLQ